MTRPFRWFGRRRQQSEDGLDRRGIDDRQDAGAAGGSKAGSADRAPEDRSAPDRPDFGPEASREQVPFRKFVLYFLRLGTTGFGGPIATVGYMQRDLVEQRGWIDRQDFLDGVALGQAMPGPLAAQVAMWVGYLQRGAWGALVIATAFIAPSFAMVLVASGLYATYSGTGLVQALFYGIAPAVMAIIAIAAYKLLKLTDRRDWRLWAISGLVFAITAITGSEPIPLILGAGLVILFFDASPRWQLRRHRSPRSPETSQPAAPGRDARHYPGRTATAGVAMTTILVLAALVVLVALIAVSGTAASATGTLVQLGLFFLRTGALVFGSGLAIVPLLRDGVVTQHHWLTQSQFLDAVAIGLITPGPVVITAGFIGFLTAGLAGSLVATIGIFTPIYVAVIVLGRWFVHHRDNRTVKAFVAGATAAAAGALSGAVVVLTREAVTDWVTALVGLVTLAVLLRFKIGEPYVVLAAGILGLVLKFALHLHL